MLTKTILLSGLLLIYFSFHTMANPMPAYNKSDFLMDSPRHVIKVANYRNSVAEVEQVVPEVRSAGRMGKSEEQDGSAAAAAVDADGQLMYVVIKPAPKPKKYKTDNQEIYMEGVKGSSANDTRMARLNLAPGAYPVFYSIAAANGKFGRNIRALSKEEIKLVEKSARG